METNSETPSAQEAGAMETNSETPSAQEIDPQAVPATEKKTVTGFAKIWTLFWFIANLGATCAPASNLTNPRLGGLVLLVDAALRCDRGGYILLYNKKPAGLAMILIANILGLLASFIQVTGYSINIRTGLIIGIITYFVTRKQVAYPSGSLRL